MLGKTHMAVGIASALAVMQPKNIPELVIGTGAAAIGGLISDIDVSTSASHKEADKIMLLAIGSIIATVAASAVFKLDIYGKIMADSNMIRMLLGTIIFIGICAFGKEQPHRSFMHSILALVLLSGSLWVIFPIVVPYFAIAFISHLATDIFNFKDVRLLYPLKGGLSFHLFHAHGIANSVLCAIGTCVAALEMLYFLVGRHLI